MSEKFYPVSAYSKTSINYWAVKGGLPLSFEDLTKSNDFYDLNDILENLIQVSNQLDIHQALEKK